jgi:hypothetical protein
MEFMITRSQIDSCLKEYDQTLKVFNIRYDDPITKTFYGGETVTFVKSGTVFIDSLESLLLLIKRIGSQIIVGEKEIEIYDDYRE